MESSCNCQESQLFVPRRRLLLSLSAFGTVSNDALNFARVRESPKWIVKVHRRSKPRNPKRRLTSCLCPSMHRNEL
jgi:hypothetical protein